MKHLIIAFAFILVFQCINASVPAPDTAGVQQLSTGQFTFIEGPAWDGEQYLYFTDIPENKIHKYSVEGGFELFLDNTSGANGLWYSGDSIIACQGGANSVVALDTNGTITSVLASDYQGTPFNSPNDLVMDQHGGIYFTDPVFGGTTNMVESVYYIADDGTVTRLIDELVKPNGVIISNDGQTLWVVDTYDQYVFSWHIDAPGTISQKDTFALLQLASGNTDNHSGADGLAVDKLGNLYVTTEIGVQVFHSTGDSLFTIQVPEKPTNCTFGGDSLDILYITARTNLYSIEIDFPEQAPVQGYVPGSNKNDISLNYEKTGVRLNKLPENTKIDVYDMTGKRVSSNKVKSSTHFIQKGGKPSGLYIVKIISTDQQQIVKIVL